MGTRRWMPKQHGPIALEQGVEALVADGAKIAKSTVFLDEIHRMNARQQEMLYTLMTKAELGLYAEEPSR